MTTGSGHDWHEILGSFGGGAIFSSWREGEADRIGVAARNVSRYPFIVRMAHAGRGPEAFYELGSELLIDMGVGIPEAVGPDWFTDEFASVEMAGEDGQVLVFDRVTDRFAHSHPVGFKEFFGLLWDYWNIRAEIVKYTPAEGSFTSVVLAEPFALEAAERSLREHSEAIAAYWATSPLEWMRERRQPIPILKLD